MRSKDSAITTRTPSRRGPFAALALEYQHQLKRQGVQVELVNE